MFASLVPSATTGVEAGGVHHAGRGEGGRGVRGCRTCCRVEPCRRSWDRGRGRVAARRTRERVPADRDTGTDRLAHGRSPGRSRRSSWSKRSDRSKARTALPIVGDLSGVGDHRFGSSTRQAEAAPSGWGRDKAELDRPPSRRLLPRHRRGASWPSITGTSMPLRLSPCSSFQAATLLVTA